MSGSTEDTTPTGAFTKPTPAAYNLARGRVASAPTSGGDGRGSKRSPRGRAPGSPTPKTTQTTADVA